MKTFAFAAACVLVAAPAFAQAQTQRSAPAQSQMAPAPRANPSTTGVAASPATADFVKKVAVSDMFEIQSSRLAQQKGDAAAKKFGNRMISDHSKTAAELKGLVRKNKLQAELPTALDPDHQQALDQLKNANNTDFNRLYDDAQKKGHQDAVALFQNYSSNGDNPALKAWAQKTLPHLQQHLQMANGLK